ncbi:hypothetical protein BLA28_22210 [Eisenbergiella tayi]|uniref:Type II secretion system protein G n=1 Tax=Eisenbergiella tayi TaxID=1432052 RepID=A0A1E3AR92_9FIRM|nr:type II secretion system protein [Eisenbergiella tayi]ODM10656.1 Type II secretion system protein G precursor [Eisenbergiella tayi]OIZ61862.1 hypothetical protein BLA28_22210 [Eisenbergiella tayi]
MNKRKAFNNKKGFTLVEMIVVIVILGILLAIMVPQLIKYVDKAKAVQCRADVSYIMKEYQIEALEKDPGNAEAACDLLESIVLEHNGKLKKKGEIFNGGIYSDVCTSKGLYTCTFDYSYKSVTVTCSEHDEEQIEIKKLADVLGKLDFTDILNFPHKNLNDYFKNGRTSINSEALSTGGYGSYGSLAKVIEAKLQEQGINMAGRSWRMDKEGDTYNLFLTDSQKITTEMEGNRVACTQYDIKNNKVIHGTIEISTEKKEKEVYPILVGTSFVPDKE